MTTGIRVLANNRLQRPLWRMMEYAELQQYLMQNPGDSPHRSRRTSACSERGMDKVVLGIRGQRVVDARR